jgi:hypothetical protein
MQYNLTSRGNGSVLYTVSLQRFELPSGDFVLGADASWSNDDYYLTEVPTPVMPGRTLEDARKETVLDAVMLMTGLDALGLYDTAEAMAKSAGGGVKIFFYHTAEWARSGEQEIAFLSALGLSEQDMDELFSITVPAT